MNKENTMINEQKTIPFETINWDSEKVPAYLTVASPDFVSIDDHTADILQFFSAYNPILTGTDSLKGFLSIGTPKNLELLIRPNGGRLVIAQNPSADAKLLKQINLRRAGSNYVELNFKDITYIFGYEHS